MVNMTYLIEGKSGTSANEVQVLKFFYLAMSSWLEHGRCVLIREVAGESQRHSPVQETLKDHSYGFMLLSDNTLLFHFWCARVRALRTL